MKDRLARLYKEGRISEEGLQKAVSGKLIAQEEYEEIVNGDVDEVTE